MVSRPNRGGVNERPERGNSTRSSHDSALTQSRRNQSFSVRVGGPLQASAEGIPSVAQPKHARSTGQNLSPHMTSFFADLLLDYEWYSARGGQVPKARACSSRKLEGEDLSAEFWFHGEGEAINHVTIVFEVENAEQAQGVVNRNIAFWRDAIAVTSVIATSHYTAAQTLGANSTLKLPRFRGHRTIWVRGVHDGQDKSSLPA
jgi:hypothetical protein